MTRYITLHMLMDGSYEAKQVFNNLIWPNCEAFKLFFLQENFA